MWTLLAIVAVLPAFGQSSVTLDSLLMELKGNIDPANRGVLLNKISYAYYSYKLDSAIYYAKLAEKEGLAHSDTSVISRALPLQGAAASSSGDLPDAIRKTEQALDLALSINDSVNIANASNNLALMDMDAGNTKQALRRFQQSLNHTTKDTLGRIYTLKNIALLYNRSGNEEASDKYMNQALQEAQTSKTPEILQILFETKGRMAMEDSTKLDSALFFFEKSIALSRKQKDVIAVISGLIQVGVIRSDMGLQEHSRQAFRKVIDLSEKKKYPFGIFYGQMGLALSYLKDKNFKKAQDAIQRVPMDHSLSLSDRLAYHELMDQYFRETGRFKDALSERDSIFFYKDSLASASRQQELARLEVKYEVEQRNRENKILAMEKEQAEQQLINQRWVLLFSVLFLCMLLAATLFVLWQRRQFSKYLEQQVEQQTQKLKKSNRELEQSNQELERFTHIASHDLKEPLRNITSFTTLLERKKELWEDHEDARDYFGHIKRSARQMDTLIQDVLSYTQVRNEEKKGQIIRVSLIPIVEQIQDTLRAKLEEKNARLYHENLTFIEGTPHHFYIMLKNLVENGLKYNKSAEPTVIIKQSLENGQPVLSVSDNGIGIPDEFKPKVADLFYRLHGRTEYEGTGLGLAIVQRLANSLDATLDIRDRPEGGTIFTIQFPN